MHPVTRLSLSSAHLAGIDSGSRKKVKLTDDQKTIKKLKKQIGEVDRKVGRLLAEARARQEFPVEISKETYDLYQKNMVKNENLLSYSLRKAIEVELLKEQLATLRNEIQPQVEDSELKGCPFCGRDINKDNHSDDCYLTLIHSPDGTTIAQVREAWNTRKELMPVGWLTPIKGDFEFFRSRATAERERREYEDNGPECNEDDQVVEVYEAFIRR